ncbi:secretin N-terminal domain-containing protein, partial [Paucibacter sp. XJ19-41]|uniref:secretin N-terminal domain-containing protein n=1 Tax=Paucibacter sp. XJ19-41 TaxID=2927824 RepID=UPI00234B5DC4
MTRTLKQRLLAPSLGLLAALLVLAGCAAEKNFRSAEDLLKANRMEDALSQYQQALRDEPTNARYRIAYLTARDKSVQQWLDQAEKLRPDVQRGNEARALYQRALNLDPDNSRAREGLVEVEREQRVAESMARARADAAQGSTTLALAGLRSVLIDRPQHAQALALQAQLLEQKNKPKTTADAKLAEAFRRPISLEFRDAQLKQVFEVLSRSSGLNFVLDKDVRGDQRTTLFLRHSTIADALALALLTNQLEQRVLDANSVLIFPNTPAKVREYQQLTVKAFVLSSSDTKTVANSLKTLLKAKDLVVDEKQNMIVMRDSPEAIELAEKVVALHDQPEAEVMLDVEILEVKRSRLIQMGVQYPSQVALAPMTAASGAQLSLSDLRHLRGSTTSVTGVNVGLQATQTNSDVNVLANPRIRSRNREKAKIQVGQRVPNITSTSTSTGFVAETVQYVEVGLKLEVEPTVSPDGEVAIKVGLEVSNILRQVQTKGGSIAYEIGTRNANTVLRLRDGENQVLAGLINDEDRRTLTGLPGLVNTPGLGGTLFGNTNNDYQKSEIVLSITPRIIRSAFRPDLVIGEFLSGTEANLRTRGAELGAGPASAAPAGPAAKPAAATEGNAAAPTPA